MALTTVCDQCGGRGIWLFRHPQSGIEWCIECINAWARKHKTGAHKCQP